MRKGTLAVAVAAALLGIGATSAKAEPPVLGPLNNTVDLRLVNHHAAPVAVYVEDVNGRAHYLGRVGISDFKILEIPGEITAMGDVTIQVYPWEPQWLLTDASPGITTKRLPIKLGDAVNIAVGTNLLATKVELEKS